MRIPDTTIADILDRLDVVQVVSDYVTLQKKGGRYWGLCPFHTEKTASFCVTPEKAVFYCFGCHKGGSLYTFVMEVEKLSFLESVRLLAEKAGVEIQPEQEGDSRREAYLELYSRVAGSLQYVLVNLPQAAAARRYLMARGIDQDCIDHFKLGYAPGARQWLFRFLREKDYSEAFLLESGLFSRGSGQRGGSAVNSFFRDRILFPIRNTRDEIVAFGGRSLSDYGPKYLNTPETRYFHKGATLFGPPGIFRRMRREETFTLVEGYMDVLALYQSGLDGVAPLGTAVTAEQIKILKRNAPRGILLFDGDEAGSRATQKTIHLCEEQDLHVSVVELGAGQDPADIVEKEGPQTLKKRLECTITSFQFLLNTALSRYDYQTPDGKQGVFEFLNSYIASVDSQVRRDGYLRLLAETLAVDYESVREDFARSRRPERRIGAAETAASSSDLFLMLAIAVNRDTYSRLRSAISVEDIEDPRAKALYIALEESYRHDETTLESLLDRIGGSELKDMLLEKISTEEFNINRDLLIQDGINRIKQRSLEKRRSALISMLSRAERYPEDLKEILSEKMHLDEELQNLRIVSNDRTAE